MYFKIVTLQKDYSDFLSYQLVLLQGHFQEFM